MKIKLFASIVAVAAFVGLVACSGYVEYVPVELRIYRGEHSLVENPALRTAAHIDAMRGILEEYSEPYKTRDGRLYIKASLQRNRDLLQNFTAKARAREMPQTVKSAGS